MLSRVADSLYWMSRYLERAEHTARLLNVHLHGVLDQQPALSDRRWTRMLASLHVHLSDDTAADPESIARALTIDDDVKGSIVNHISAARRNAREVREQISTEMWEQLNRLYLFVHRTDHARIGDGQTHPFLQEVKQGAHLFQGITDGTMSHDEGWYFIQLGRYIERVLATVSLLRVHVADPTGGNGTDLDAHGLEWIDLLKSCTAYEAYCRLHTAHIVPAQATAFLLLHPDFPHSVRFGVGRIQRALDALAESIPALKHSDAPRIAGKLASTLRFDSIEDITRGDVGRYLDDIRARCTDIDRAVYDACISYPIERALAG